MTVNMFSAVIYRLLSVICTLEDHTFIILLQTQPLSSIGHYQSFAGCVVLWNRSDSLSENKIVNIEVFVEEREEKLLRVVLHVILIYKVWIDRHIRAFVSLRVSSPRPALPHACAEHAIPECASMNKERGEERIHKQATRINWERTNPQERKTKQKGRWIGWMGGSQHFLHRILLVRIGMRYFHYTFLRFQSLFISSIPLCSPLSSP